MRPTPSASASAQMSLLGWLLLALLGLTLSALGAGCCSAAATPREPLTMARPEIGPLPDVRIAAGVVAGGSVAVNPAAGLDGLEVYVIEARPFDEVMEIRRGLLLNLYSAPWWSPPGAPDWLIGDRD